jgi:hypothetical protein
VTLSRHLLAHPPRRLTEYLAELRHLTSGNHTSLNVTVIERSDIVLGDAHRLQTPRPEPLIVTVHTGQ